ncbi:hypothetical protein QIX46_17875 [Lysinibacillus boronitolerans]|jgi:hypothetical protein|nr:hypothetical protein QIX46_17875 [Lysinibacillus boronitolerans]
MNKTIQMENGKGSVFQGNFEISQEYGAAFEPKSYIESVCGRHGKYGKLIIGAFIKIDNAPLYFVINLYNRENALAIDVFSMQLEIHNITKKYPNFKEEFTNDKCLLDMLTSSFAKGEESLLEYMGTHFEEMPYTSDGVSTIEEAYKNLSSLKEMYLNPETTKVWYFE